MTVETVELRPGYGISRVIKGGWQLAGDHGHVDRADAIGDMESFLDAGITSFDCADIYTGVEEMIGTFIADVRKRRGADIADKVQVHTKLVPDLERLPDLTATEVEAIVEQLHKISKPVKANDRKAIETVATIAGNNDKEIGKILADALLKVGKD